MSNKFSFTCWNGRLWTGLLNRNNRKSLASVRVSTNRNFMLIGLVRVDTNHGVGNFATANCKIASIYTTVVSFFTTQFASSVRNAMPPVFCPVPGSSRSYPGEPATSTIIVSCSDKIDFLIYNHRLWNTSQNE